jgi:hypothetical protein
MSKSAKTAEQTAAVATPASTPAAPVKEPVTTVKANDRGYAFLGRITGAPESFKGIKKAVRTDSETQTVLECGKGEDCGNMLRRGYLHIGKNAKAEVVFGSNGEITVNLAKARKMPAAKVETPAEAVVA